MGADEYLIILFVSYLYINLMKIVWVLAEQLHNISEVTTSFNQILIKNTELEESARDWNSNMNIEVPIFAIIH